MECTLNLLVVATRTNLGQAFELPLVTYYLNDVNKICIHNENGLFFRFVDLSLDCRYKEKIIQYFEAKKYMFLTNDKNMFYFFLIV